MSQSYLFLRRGSLAWIGAAIAFASFLPSAAALAATSVAGRFDAPLSLVVMDPLAAPLSCPCVAGYAQRRYEVLGEYLSRRLGQPVQVTFSETIAGALEKPAVEAVDLIVGKDSVVRAEGARLKLEPRLLARLTGKDGKTSQHGLIVVRSGDPAQAVAELKGYRILFGPPDCVEKFSAARRLLEKAGVTVPPVDECETTEACSDGATKLLEWGDSERAAAVISSYAAPLLEGCGTIKKGDLRVVGQTRPVPFVAAFATNRLNEAQRAVVAEALFDVATDPQLLVALESLLGFIEPEDDAPPLEKAKPKSAAGDAPSVQPSAADAPPADAQSWSGWLGPTRDGRCQWLPRQLPDESDESAVVWRRPLSRSGLGGLAATDRFVLLGDRDAANVADVFRCLSAETGDQLWQVAYPAPGRLDYDNCPRATPLIVGDRVILFGAFGDLTCAELATGEIVWQTNVRRQFLAIDELPWGTCSTPLPVDGMVVVNPGAEEASLAALDLESGEVVWQTPGEPQGHGSLIAATLGGVRQIVGHSQTRLNGWDAETGRQLWSVAPQTDGDFNVPTPIVVEGKLLVCTENNGARLFAFDAAGRIHPTPVAVNEELAPETSTPVSVGARVYGVCGDLLALDAGRNLAKVGSLSDDALGDYAPILAADERLLIQGRGGELLLVDVSGPEPRIVSRRHVALSQRERSAALLTTPALVGGRLYVRGEREVACLDLAGIR
jgi:ABC-type phosphate/phosphonate transport system substrate-binding protein/outer membrane protein assembly factor BamB